MLRSLLIDKMWLLCLTCSEGLEELKTRKAFCSESVETLYIKNLLENYTPTALSGLCVSGTDDQEALKVE